jgi:F-type H+-transporting ATPase subunit gamma
VPGGKERELKRRISSVQSTKKITRAMELIAATRVVKAMQRADSARPYARQITSVIENLTAGGAQVDHPLLREVEEVKRVGIIVMAGDRGLAGAYNSNPIRAAERELMAHQAEGRDYSLFCVGKKATGYFRFRHYRVDHSYVGFTDNPTYNDCRTIADDVARAFTSGEIDEVELIYTEFISMGTQHVSIRRFLPLEDTATIAEAGGGSADAASAFEFEPSPEAVLESLLPRYVEARLFGALLECAASEHANRQRAMKSATDNAEDLIVSLSREMNAARQASITTEIMEIVSGAEALGSGDHIEDLAALVAEFDSAATATAVLDPGPYGVGSHAPLADDSAPAGFTIKGNEDSMLYHRPDSRSYSVTRAEVWFDTPERAEAAGFRLANTHPNSDS